MDDVDLLQGTAFAVPVTHGRDAHSINVKRVLRIADTNFVLCEGFRSLGELKSQVIHQTLSKI